MANVQFDIIGEPGRISASTFFRASRTALSLLREFDAAISGRYQGTLKWYVAGLHDNGSLSIRFRSDPRPPKKKKGSITNPSDFGPEVTGAFVTGFDNIEHQGISLSLPVRIRNGADRWVA